MTQLSKNDLLKLHSEFRHISWTTVTLTVLSIWVISRGLKLIRGLKNVNYLPGRIMPFQPLAFPGSLFAASWWNIGMDGPWVERFQLYKRYNSENISIVPFISGRPLIYTSNAHVMRQVAAGSHKTSWVKPEYSSAVFIQWGINLFGADGEVWRRHRRIMGPAFHKETYTQVWDETIKTYNEMIDAEGWAGKDMVDVPIVQKLTSKFTLLVIGTCGFGFPFTWNEPPYDPDGQITIQECLRIVSGFESVIFTFVAPKWAFKIPLAWIQKINTARCTLERFMLSQVEARKVSIRSQLADGVNEGGNNKDVFTLLVRANELEGKDKLRLTDHELIGNVFIMLFGGHETTANTLAATLGYLALNEDLQDEAVEQIQAVCGGRDPTIHDYPKLDQVRALFFEASRMIPSGSIMFREATEDTILEIPNLGGEGFKPMAVPKGMTVIVDMIGIQYNPRYFPEPHIYRPSRWHGVPSDSETFTAFSVGPRTCIGRKFATTEAVCFLTLFLRDWRIEPILRGEETKSECGERVLQAKLGLSLAVGDLPLRFVRRKLGT